jgi:hypothetical protein
LTVAVFLAIAITAFTILPTNSRGVWALNWALVWPAWYIVATALGETGKPDKAEMAEMRRIEQ